MTDHFNRDASRLLEGRGGMDYEDPSFKNALADLLGTVYDLVNKLDDLKTQVEKVKKLDGPATFDPSVKASVETLLKVEPVADKLIGALLDNYPEELEDLRP